MIKRTIKSALLKGLGALKPGLSGASILMYHSVGSDSAFFTVHPDEFRRQMLAIKESGYPVRRLTDVVNDLRTGKEIEPCIVITFDDGYVNNITEALPILREFGFPATIFVATGLVGKTYTNSEKITLPIMSAAQIDEARKSNLIDLMPHGHMHINLLKASEEELRKDLADSIDALRVKNPILAYPWGKHDDRTVSIAKELGFIAAVGVQEGIVRKG